MQLVIAEQLFFWLLLNYIIINIICVQSHTHSLKKAWSIGMQAI